MPRECLICRDPDRTKLVMELIAGGVSDRAIARQLGGLSHTSVARHRQNHIERPAKAIVKAANKGKDVRDERDQLVAAAEAGDTAAAFLALNQIAADLRRVQERLERTADAAETDKQRLAVASLSGQQLRAAEVRAKLSGVGGYATPRSDKGNAPKFELNIIFSGGHTQRIEGTPMHPDDPGFNAVPAVPLSIGGGTHDGDTSGLDEEQDDETGFDDDV
jgi:hypothetical protein